MDPKLIELIAIVDKMATNDTAIFDLCKKMNLRIDSLQRMVLLQNEQIKLLQKVVLTTLKPETETEKVN